MVCLFSQSGKKIQVNSSKEKGRGKKSCSTSVFFHHGWKRLARRRKGGPALESAVSVCFPPRCFDQLLFPLLCQKFIKKRVHRKRDRKDQPSFTEKAPLLEEYNSSYESLVCVCFFPF